MDHDTVEVYEKRADEWHAARSPRALGGEKPAPDLGRLAAGNGDGQPVADLGCGPGWFTAGLGPSPVVAVDAARTMLDLVPRYAPSAWRVQADLAALPFRQHALAGGLARRSYVHLSRSDMPLALADLHRCHRVGAPIELEVFQGDLEYGTLDGDDFAGRRFSLWPEAMLRDVLVGAGFDIERFDGTATPRGDGLRVRLTRLQTLADTVGPQMRLLVVGLNPSLYSADHGVAFFRPGNRFWPAALAAGLVTRDRDPRHALAAHHVGLTDVVKRATARADSLTPAEYHDGLGRITRLAGWLKPRAICFVGLAGWRAAVDRRAVAGPQTVRLGDAPVYLMPSTSGVNGHASLKTLTAHLEAAGALADRTP